jgi:Fe-S-cluster containining protein
MYLKYTIKSVTRIFREADLHIATFQFQSKLSCAPNCGWCCTKSNIEATVLEFLPAAYNLYLSGQFNTILDSIENKTDTLCVFYNPFSDEGFCSYYHTRGLVCRLFGFSKKTDKTGAHTLVTCKPIKQLINFKNMQNILPDAPEMSEYYLRLYGIDPSLAIHYLPINQSIKKALEIVLLHFQYKKKPA